MTDSRVDYPIVVGRCVYCGAVDNWFELTMVREHFEATIGDLTMLACKLARRISCPLWTRDMLPTIDVDRCRSVASTMGHLTGQTFNIWHLTIFGNSGKPSSVRLDNHTST
ncbi:hypothetical protein Fot_34917 [Forsythia ovata]|uniref:Uncharacterized protein n=1 Tax=Forsythia ovata TaxID=205694 RepID=A0ABD1SMX5_9LAMI